MKWFHHDTEASQDPRMQLLGMAHGATGLGIYWGIIERIGYHSETFRMKVSGLSDEADRQFAADFRKEDLSREVLKGYPRQPERIPDISLKILAKSLFTSKRKLKVVINTCVRAGLLDEKMWSRYNILFSSTPERGADTYTQRRMRLHQGQTGGTGKAAGGVRTMCEESMTVRTLSDNVSPEQEQEGEEDKEKNIHTEPVSIGNVIDSLISRNNHSSAHQRLKRSPFRPSTNEFREYCMKLRGMLLQWNSSHEQRFDWVPTEDQLKMLFYAGTEAEKESICYKAMNVLKGELSYPEVVLRAVRLMLDASNRIRIMNPMAWLWSCLHGNGKGRGPWAQLTTAERIGAIGPTFRSG